MKVLVVGGGSGGHITPAVAVVRELLEIKPRTRIEFWTDRKYYKNVVKITTELGVRWGEQEKTGNKDNPYIRVRKICAGKFHRYAGWKFKDYFINWQITFKDIIWGNIVGFCGFVGGWLQSFFRLFSRENRPDVMFLKGGFVCLPVGLVAKIFRIPYVVHESDVVPGLANRILMKKAKIVAFGMPFDEEKAKPNWKWVGVPVAPEFKKISETQKKTLKKTFGFNPDQPLVIVTGGSQGSVNMNEAMRQILPRMLEFTSVGLVAGRKHYEDMVDLKKYEEWDKAKLQSNFRLWEFNSSMNELMGAADVVISRAGATTIAELAGLSKAVVLVPFEKLPGGHQVKNAERLEKKGAVLSVRDDKMVKNPEILLDEVRSLIRSPKKREEMAAKLHEEARPDAAKALATIVIDIADGKDLTKVEEDAKAR